MFLGLLLFRKSNIALFCLGFCLFYYNSQFDYLYYKNGATEAGLISGYIYYYISLYLFIFFIFITLILQPYRRISFVNYDSAKKKSSFLYGLISILAFFYVVDVSSLATSSRPAMTDFGYLVSMLLFVSSFLSLSSGLKFFGVIQLLFLLFLSKLLFLLVIIYFICVSDKIKGVNLYIVTIFLIFVFFGWGLLQDNLNYSAESESVNQFLSIDFFFNYVIEGATSITSQVQRAGDPDFGLSLVISALLRLIPGSILREYGLNLVPEGISESIVISGVESSIIHFGILGPIFFASITCILLLFFNRSKYSYVKFICCVSIFFFLRSGSFSFVNNLIVLLVLFVFNFFLILSFNLFIRK